MSKYIRKYTSSSVILGADVANAATFDVAVPSPYAFFQLSYLLSLMVPQNNFIIVDNNDKFSNIALAFSSGIITVTNNTGQTLKAGSKVVLSMELPNFEVNCHEFPVDLVTITAAADVYTANHVNYDGSVLGMEASVIVPVTTAARAATLNVEIGSTDVVGGVLALTSANLATKGATVISSAVTGANAFKMYDVLSIEASAVTAFAEGRVLVRLFTKRDPTPEIY